MRLKLSTGPKVTLEQPRISATTWPWVRLALLALLLLAGTFRFLCQDDDAVWEKTRKHARTPDQLRKIERKHLLRTQMDLALQLLGSLDVPQKHIPRVRRLARLWIFLLTLVLLLGCGPKFARMERPEVPQGRYHEQIAVAKRLLDQKEDWADLAEWEVIKSGDGWQVIIWRVEHPDRAGPNRDLPWGYSVIEIDSRMVAVGYRKKDC